MIDSPQPSNISYMWNIGSLLGICLIIQILTGVFITQHYSSNIELAFLSVEHLVRDVSYGWILRYAHANGASLFMVLVYIHIARGIYYGSYKYPRIALWNIGVIIFLLMIITAFLGYCLCYGQMSHWGATVIISLASAIPYIGQDIVNYIWGAGSVSGPTISRFFAFHYLFPFILIGLVLLHLLTLHKNGSNNPLGITGNIDRLPFHPYYSFKDLITVFIYLLIFSYLIFFNPNALSHPDNSIEGNPMVTPASIVPEFYLLPFYAILRAIPSKLGGVIIMISSILILLLLPYVDLSIIRGNAFKLLSKLFYSLFICNFLLLGLLGSAHIELPYILLSQLATVFYFSYFLIILPSISILENILFLLCNPIITRNNI